MPSLTRIKETCLYVNDLERTQAFYHDKMGLPVISFVPDRHVFFRAGDSVLLCFNTEATKQEAVLPPHWGEGKLHYAFECLPEEYEAWKKLFNEQQIPITHEQEWKNGLKSFYFEDPDGHVGEIVMHDIWG